MRSAPSRQVCPLSAYRRTYDVAAGRATHQLLRPHGAHHRLQVRHPRDIRSDAGSCAPRPDTQCAGTLKCSVIFRRRGANVVSGGYAAKGARRRPRKRWAIQVTGWSFCVKGRHEMVSRRYMEQAALRCYRKRQNAMSCAMLCALGWRLPLAVPPIDTVVSVEAASQMADALNGIGECFANACSPMDGRCG